MLKDGAAKPLHYRSDRLPVRQKRVENTTDILHRDVVEYSDAAGLHVHRHMGSMHSATERLHGFIVENVGHVDAPVSFSKERRQFGQGNGHTLVVPEECAFAPFHGDVRTTAVLD